MTKKRHFVPDWYNGTPSPSSGIADGSVTLPKLADIATDHILGRDTAGTGDVEALTPAQARSVITSDSGGGTTNFLRADGSFAVPPGLVAPASLGLAFFGAGTDGAAAFDGVNDVAGATRSGTTYTLQRHAFYTDATLSAGVQVKTAGWRLHANGTLTFGAGSSINADGASATGVGPGTAGVGQSSAWSGASGGGAIAPANSAGNAGANVSGSTIAIGASSSSTGLGGSAGNNGTAGNVRCRGGGGGGGATTNAGGNAGSITTATNTNGYADDIISAFRARGEGATTAWLGGSGGGAGGGGSAGTGGSSGAGGAVCIVAARVIAGAGLVSANGGAGSAGTGTGGGGGGAGGGLAVLVYASCTGTKSVTAIGGAGGVGPATNGGAGGDGFAFAFNISGDGT